MMSSDLDDWGHPHFKNPSKFTQLRKNKKQRDAGLSSTYLEDISGESGNVWNDTNASCSWSSYSFSWKSAEATLPPIFHWKITKSSLSDNPWNRVFKIGVSPPDSNLNIGVMGFELFILFDTNRNRQEGPYDSCIQEYISTPASIFRYMLSNINCIKKTRG